ncbi:phosphate signaling complex protein PhoU [Chitinispirillales bacterium ANBcel5]|uniref:phosphate signaling complex protein PhoU n=1 Tax=Cellulosispirillum alkaliphilum TaxID=3039283 RepID=UPI002A565C36|nr:phosphate signaling complex protein PhoU [Chitinispirillales bacterium ANBcel5]
MSNHFYIETEKLKQRIMGLCTLVEESVRYSVKSALNLDHSLAHKVIGSDEEIDMEEVEIEEDCLKILALYQPVARDLRFVIAVLKINNDLERIADLAVNIAERTIALTAQPPENLRNVCTAMSEKAVIMLKKSIDSLINWDGFLAVDVCESDNEVDTLYKDSFELVKNCILEDPARLDSLYLYSSIFRHLERIADQTTNIAEDVIYMTQGGIVRHTNEQEKKATVATSHKA